MKSDFDPAKLRAALEPIKVEVRLDPASTIKLADGGTVSLSPGGTVGIDPNEGYASSATCRPHRCLRCHPRKTAPSAHR